MLRFIRVLPALGAFFVVAFVLSACGDSVPGNAVVRVGDENITRTEFNHWMGVAQASSRGTSPTAKIDYNPPDFSDCVAQQRKTAPKPGKGQPKPTDATFKAQCAQEYEQFKNQVLQFLISERWVRGEAADQGIKLTDKQLNAEFAKVRKQSFPKDQDFQKFLKNAGMTVDDAKLQVQFNTLSTKLREKVTKTAGKVTNTEIAAYYAKKRDTFGEPEKRDVRVVLAKTKGKADQALKALRGGRSWKAVAQRFSIDPGTKRRGGVISGLAKGQQDPAVDSAIFSSQVGKLTGPIKTQFGYYVVQVQKITPRKQQTLKQATPSIKQQLEIEHQRTVITKFSDDLKKKWRARTNCRAGYVTEDCKNAKKQKTTATTPATGQPVPQQPQQP
jgi:foldase protein PrsA